MHTVVIAWPVDGDGYLLSDRLHAAKVLVWRLPPSSFERLRELHEGYHLGRHDLWIRWEDEALHMSPCPRSLRAVVDVHDPDLANRLGGDIELLRSRLTRHETGVSG